MFKRYFKIEDILSEAQTQPISDKVKCFSRSSADQLIVIDRLNMEILVKILKNIDDVTIILSKSESPKSNKLK